MSVQRWPQTPLPVQQPAPTVLQAKHTATHVLPATTAPFSTMSQSHAQQVTTALRSRLRAQSAQLAQCARMQTSYQDSAPSGPFLVKELPTARAAQPVRHVRTMVQRLSVAIISCPIRMALLVSIAPLVWLALPNSGVRWSCVALATIQPKA